MTEPSVRRAAAVTFPLIIAVFLILFTVSYLLSTLLGFPFSLNLPTAARLLGGAIVLAGLGVMGWTFVNRNPVKVLVSTYVTFTKMFRRVPISEKAGRTEPLIVSGPQKYTRNPLYFGIVVMVLGWALASAYSFVFVAAVAVLLWFSLFLIPFEERELGALFGEQWTRYSQETPVLIPFTKRKKHTDR